MQSNEMNENQIRNPQSAIRNCHVGCQGWNYEDWITKAGGDEVFYPYHTRANEMLTIYAKAFNTVEVDSTFYAIPSESSVEGWYKKTPSDFTFSLKLPQTITHEQFLHRSSFPTLVEFCERIRILKEKLGCVLIQLPPQFVANPFNATALKEFLPALPRDIRFAIEFRSRDWIHTEILEQLSKHNVTLALVEGQWLDHQQIMACAEQPTADFVYIRWMGERNLTSFDKVVRPQDENLLTWSKVIKRLSFRVDKIYATFSNFYEGHAPASANKLKTLLRQPTVEASNLETQPSLF
jgi:uncharacterized protein YecE (DUF72 family)